MEGESRVLLLNVYLPPPSPPQTLVSVHDKLRKHSVQKLEEERASFQKHATSSKISFETLSHIGSPENVIPYLIQEQKIDCVILGIEGNLQNGTVKLLSRIECPALVIPFFTPRSQKLS